MVLPKLYSSKSHLLTVFAANVMLCASFLSVNGQGCPDQARETSGSHRFRQLGETIEIPLSLGDCQPVALELRWTNGRNTGSMFRVTFLDESRQVIYSKHISGFMTGTRAFPLESFESRPWHGSRRMLSVPATVTIETLRPFAPPANLSYKVIRDGDSTNPSTVVIDQDVLFHLQNAMGRVLVRGNGFYRLEEVTLYQPAELEFNGKSETVSAALRLIITDRDFPAEGLIWVDDAALPFSNRKNAREVGAVVFDFSILRHGARISVSKKDGSQMFGIPERLSLPEHLRPMTRPRKDDGNSIVNITNAVRVVGNSRQKLVQIVMQTKRPFPAVDSPLWLQIGKRFFVNELSGDHSGRTLMVTLTPEMFAEIEDDAEVTAFLYRPDHSGFSGKNVWYFGRLKKRLLDQ